MRVTVTCVWQYYVCCSMMRDACAQLLGSPLPQVLQADGAITSHSSSHITAHADGDWISAEDVTHPTPPPLNEQVVRCSWRL